jgi:uncharacterized membrane protein YphA (DoxX/SURF4 family)
MLNPFPLLLSFGLFGPLLIRVALGIIFIYISYEIIYKNKDKFLKYYKSNNYPFPELMTWFFGILTAIVGAFFILGFLTQIVAIIAVYLLISLALSDKEIQTFKFHALFYLITIVTSLSMILLGAGAFAIDLPL